jgi:ubiquinone/menaquinone biosynthesis C-methylase UbiE
VSSWFSAVAREYATYRPHYPAALFKVLSELAPQRALAWDCGCGNGQASVEVAAYFDQVVATDISEQQVAAAEPHPRVEYRVAPAEQSGLASASVSLVTVAQALHWFDVDAFHAEARRVLAPGGVIAEWCYPLLDVPDAPDVADVITDMDARMRTWWPPQRAHVDAHYRDLPFPFAQVTHEAFTSDALAMTASWTAEQMVGYVSTWSAVSRYRTAHAEDPVMSFADRLHDAWGTAARHTIRWPLVIRVGRS